MICGATDTFVVGASVVPVLTKVLIFMMIEKKCFDGFDDDFGMDGRMAGQQAALKRRFGGLLDRYDSGDGLERNLMGSNGLKRRCGLMEQRNTIVVEEIKMDDDEDNADAMPNLR